MKFKLFIYYKIFRYFHHTIRFNFHYFSIKEALKFPVIFYCQTDFVNLKGTVEINGSIKYRMIGFGYPGNSMMPAKGIISWDNKGGKIILHGSLGINPGLSLKIHEGAILEIGENVSIGQNAMISCYEKIVIGKNLLCSWDVIFFDNDFHLFYDIDNQMVLKKSIPIQIGENVFIGCRTTLLKGTVVPFRATVGSNSLLNKNYGNIPCSLITGNPANVNKIRRTRLIDENISLEELENIKTLTKL